MPIDTGRSYEVPAQVSIRQEKFGGLVYRYDNRALLFLHSKPLVDFLVSMESGTTLGESLEGFATENQLGDGQKLALVNALGQLETKGIIRELRPAA